MKLLPEKYFNPRDGPSMICITIQTQDPDYYLDLSAEVRIFQQFCV